MTKYLLLALSLLSILSCKKEESENQSPAKFNLLAPANNSIDHDFSVTLEWEKAIDPDGDPIYYEIYMGTNDNPITKIGDRCFQPSFTLDTLRLSTSYRWKIAAIDKYGNSTQSEEWKFTIKEATYELGSFTDARDGRVYLTVKNGTQTWMAENLAYLPTINSYWDYNSSSKPCYYVCEYEGNNLEEAKQSTEYKKYGVLYNKVAALEACPDGWHLPSDEEWKTLETYIGISLYDLELLGSDYRAKNFGQKLKSTSGWEYDGIERNGTNETGFNALPGREAGNPGTHTYATFWTATHREYDNWGGRSYARGLGIYSYVYRYNYPDYFGLSVRCIKD